MSQKGVTLIELVLSIVILSIVALIVGQAFFYSSKSVLTGNQAREATQEGRLGIDRMIREIRSIRDGRCVIIANSQRLSFVDANNDTIDFNWNGVQGTSLTRTENGVTNTLVGNVNNVLPGTPLFTYYDNANPRNAIATPTVCGAPNTCTSVCAVTEMWSIRVDLDTKYGTETMEFRSEVHPMNF